MTTALAAALFKNRLIQRNRPKAVTPCTQFFQVLLTIATVRGIGGRALGLSSDEVKLVFGISPDGR